MVRRFTSNTTESPLAEFLCKASCRTGVTIRWQFQDRNGLMINLTSDLGNGTVSVLELNTTGNECWKVSTLSVVLVRSGNVSCLSTSDVNVSMEVRRGVFIYVKEENISMSSVSTYKATFPPVTLVTETTVMTSPSSSPTGTTETTANSSMSSVSTYKATSLPVTPVTETTVMTSPSSSLTGMTETTFTRTIDFSYLATLLGNGGTRYATLLGITKEVLKSQTRSLSGQEVTSSLNSLRRLSVMTPDLPVNEALEAILFINVALEELISDLTLDTFMIITETTEKIITSYARQTRPNEKVLSRESNTVIYVENADAELGKDWFTVGGSSAELGRSATPPDDFSQYKAAIYYNRQDVDSASGSLSVAMTYREFPEQSIAENITNVDITEPPSMDNTTIVERKLLSALLSFTVTDQNQSRSVPVTFSLKHNKALLPEQTIRVNSGTRVRRSRATCVFWQDDEQLWSNQGCHHQSGNTSSLFSSCQCNHTSSFTIMMQITETEIAEEHNRALTWLAYVGCCLSLVALMMAFVIFTYLRSLRSDRMFIHKNLVVALIFSNILFIAGVEQTRAKVVCKTIAIFLHLSYLSVFAWMLVEGFHLYSLVVRVFGSETTQWKVYALVGWGLPVVIVSTTTAINHKAYGTERGCWLTVDGGFIWAFVGPALGTMTVNLVILTMVVKITVQSAKSGTSDVKKQVKTGIKGTVLLLPLLGLTWSFGILGINSDTIVFLYLFTIFNSLQGFFVFIFHCIMNSEVRQALAQKRRQLFESRGEFLTRSTNKSNPTSEEGTETKLEILLAEEDTSRSMKYVSTASSKAQSPVQCLITPQRWKRSEVILASTKVMNGLWKRGVT